MAFQQMVVTIGIHFVADQFYGPGFTLPCPIL
jgi:hypothetical protein